MSMSTHVVGFIPPDEYWKKMKAIYDACKAAHVPLPKEVDMFFGDETPDERGVERNLVKAGHAVEWSDGHSRQGYEIDLRLLPSVVKIIRFYNAY